MVNMRKFIRKITLLEGRRREMSIAQVGEVVKLTLEELSKMKQRDIDKVLKRYRRCC